MSQDSALRHSRRDIHLGGMYSLQQDLLHSVGQEQFIPVEHVFSNATVVEFVKETTVRHLVERLAKIKQSDVYLMTCRKLVGNLTDSDYKLGFAGVPASKPVLTVAEYLILVEVLHDGTVDSMLQYLVRDGRW